MQKVLKKTEADKTIDFFVTFLSLVTFQYWRGGGPAPLSGYAYARGAGPEW